LGGNDGLLSAEATTTDILRQPHGHFNVLAENDEEFKEATYRKVARAMARQRATVGGQHKRVRPRYFL
jgi:hypothetical protein